ncbi:MAG: hypothetical protein ACREWI_04685 [Telluria sp.]
MKKFMMAVLACTLLGGCVTNPSGGGQQLAQQEESYTPTGSNIPRKKGQGTIQVSTMSAVELESARMNPGQAPALPAGQ